MSDYNTFLPISRRDLEERGWYWYDFLVVTGDAYVDHPSFGTAIIARLLEAEGYRVAILAQPDWHSAAPFAALGRPRLGVLISGGNIDSMVAHYTAARKRRHDDAYSPGNRGGLRPVYGMGESATREIAARLASGTPVGAIRDVRGTAFLARDPSACVFPKVECPSFADVREDKRAYAQANQVQYEEHDPYRGRAVLQRHGERLLVVNPPALPLTTAELDEVAELPYVREPHPMYDSTIPWGACPPLKRSVSRWPITGGALGRVISAPWPSTRGGLSPAAVTKAFCGRWRTWSGIRGLRAIFTM